MKFIKKKNYKGHTFYLMRITIKLFLIQWHHVNYICKNSSKLVNIVLWQFLIIIMLKLLITLILNQPKYQIDQYLK